MSELVNFSGLPWKERAALPSVHNNQFLTLSDIAGVLRVGGQTVKKLHQVHRLPIAQRAFQEGPFWVAERNEFNVWLETMRFRFPKDAPGLSPIARDCKACGVESKNTGLHHIIPRHYHGSDNEENLIRLCQRCHKLAHSFVEVGIGTLERRLRTSDVIGATKFFLRHMREFSGRTIKEFYEYLSQTHEHGSGI